MGKECFPVRRLQVIHGYPPLHNAGAEVCTQTLCHTLVQDLVGGGVSVGIQNIALFSGVRFACFIRR